MFAEPTLPPLFRNPDLSPRLKVLLATADTATERNDRVLGVQCIVQIFAEFDSCGAEPAKSNSAEAA